MEIYNRKAPRYKHKLQTQPSYLTDLQFYTTPPIENITLKEFDDFALERLKILRAIERVNLSEIKSSEEWINKLYEDFNKNKYFVIQMDKSSGTKMEERLNARRKDHLSHFILRLAYCRTEELRRWFVGQETDLFRVRFLRAAAKGFDFSSFLNENHLHFSQIDENEFVEERKNLADGTFNINGVDQLENKIFFKVPFVEALDLVQSRKVFVKNGFAYVPSSSLISLVCPAFRSKLSEALTITCRALPKVDDDARLFKLLRDFDKRYTGADFSQKKNTDTQITPQMIKHLANTAFPLCMKQMQDHMNVHNHLKHWGRMQYGLFLKAAGLNLEDALKFWRSHFTKNMDVDKFEKQYAYNIRHNYGKEGKRVNYSPYSCIKIITSSVGPGDTHGCPFKHCDAGLLKQKLSGFSIPQKAVSDIMDLASKHHYQIACQRFFEARYNSVIESGINHPNQYFEESFALKRGLKAPAEGRPQRIQTKSNNEQDETTTTSQNSVQDSMDFEDDVDDSMKDIDMSQY